MPHGRRPRIMNLRPALLAGAALAACSGAAAYAQEAAAPPQPFSLEAETITRDSQGVITAEGDVQGRYQDRTLRADQLSYDVPGQIISAQGDVQIVDDQGNAEFADTAIFNQDLTAGVATGFAAREGAAKFAASSVIRYSESLNELNRAIFTPCEICAADGSPKQPTWSIAADRIVQDRDRKLVYYRNAIIRIKGVPVFWTPIFWHADPQADRASGLLAPRFSQTRRRGLSYEQPYLWAISPYQDLVVSPQFNTEVSPFLNAEWRKRFYSGSIDARFGFTREQDFNTAGVQFGDTRDKAYVLATGQFKPTEDWTWGFSAERARDKFLFDQYSIADIYESRGIFLSDDRRLLSQLYAVRQTNRSYISVAALSFQSLRPLLTAPPNPFGIRPFEDDDTMPLVAPLIEARWEPEAPVLGGRLRITGGGVALRRSESPLVPGEAGVDSARATIEGDWRSSYTLSSGVRFEPFANLRGDYYDVSDLTPGSGSVATTRALATIGVDVSWPFIRQFGRTTVILEPLAQVALSPDTKAYRNIPNEDSIAFDFDETNLFEANKSPGFDLYEGGQRLNVGVRASADWGGGRNAQVVVGRSFRADPAPASAARAGLAGRSSDWVVAAQANVMDGLSFYTKARLGDEDLDIHRVEFGADIATSRADGQIRYLREDQDFAGVFREDIEAVGDLFFTQRWGVSFDAVHDLAQDTWRRRTVGIVYRDECMRFDVTYERNENPVLGGRAAWSLGVGLTVAINGDAGYMKRNSRWRD